MLKVLRQRGMSVQQAQLLLQHAPSSSTIHRDTLRAFHGTCSTVPCDTGNIHMGCHSFKAVALSSTHGRSNVHYLRAFLGSQSLGRSGSFCTHIHTLKGKAASQEHDVTQESNAGHVPCLSTQRRGLKVEAATNEAVHGLEISEHEGASGSIHLIVGPMFAGKTTALLQRVEAEASTGRRVALVKSDKDTRYGLTSIVSHDGRRMPCWAVPSLGSFRSQIGEEEYAKLDLIGIDEAQFLKDLCSFCQTAADYEGKTLIVAGLDGDFQRNKFGSILDLIPLADSVVKLSSHCELCGRPASFTFRKTDDRNKEVIGGTDIYMPVCRQHYYSGQVALEATRTVLGTHKFMSLQSDKSEKAAKLLFDSEF